MEVLANTFVSITLEIIPFNVKPTDMPSRKPPALLSGRVLAKTNGNTNPGKRLNPAENKLRRFLEIFTF
jgi:hypothetical protein